MKATINGIQVEGTPSEIMEYEQLVRSHTLREAKQPRGIHIKDGYTGENIVLEEDHPNHPFWEKQEGTWGISMPVQGYPVVVKPLGTAPCGGGSTLAPQQHQPSRPRHPANGGE